MKVEAKHWVNYNGKWHKNGDVFTVNDEDAAEMAQFVEVVNIPDDVPESEPEQAEAPKRGRKRKAEE